MRKYEDVCKTIPVSGRNGNMKLSSVMDGAFLGWDSMSIRYGLVDGCGFIPEETEKLHTHEYDQMIWLLSSDPEDMLNLGAELEMDLGPNGIRHRIATPCAIVLPKGTPHFSPIVTRVDRPFFVFAVSCAGEMKAEIADADAVPGTGPWSRFFGEFSGCIRNLTFSANDPYHYGSSRSQPSGGVSAHVNSASTKVPLTMTWSTVHQPHDLGPWGEDGRHRGHVHQDYDEALIFLSLDTDNLTDLHGKAVYSVGKEGTDMENYLLTKATVMAMRQGTWHLPLTFTEVERPMVFITLGNH